jgi:3-oxoacyl-[acyl-carrier protein] reductase
MKLLEGRNALITGGGRGIGRAVALEFARNGANVAITALEANELEETIREIEKSEVKGLSIPVDLTNIEEIEIVAKKFFDNFNKCDILVNNAGMSYYCPMLDVSLSKALKLFQLNLIAYYAMVKLIIPDMIERKSGKILMTASVHGNMFFNPNQVAYSSTKAGVSAMGKCLHNELKPFNIQVNVILPSAIQTKLFENSAQRGQITPNPISPEEIAPIYLFLASDLSSRKYKGRIINQLLLFDLLPKINMKDTLRKNESNLLRKNQDLVDFLINYKV